MGLWSTTEMHFRFCLYLCRILSSNTNEASLSVSPNIKTELVKTVVKLTLDYLEVD